MQRIAFFLLILIIACNNSKQSERIVSKIDSVKVKPRESFDLKVRKYEDPSRQIWQDPKFVIEALGDLNNLVIADIGSGTGYFTFQMAVPAKKVIAIDIEQRFLNYIEDRKSEMYDRNLAGKIETRLTTPDVPSLMQGEVDVVLMVNTIGYIDNKTNYLETLKESLKKNGRIVIVDYKLGKMPVGPSEVSKVGEVEITKTLKQAGYILDKVDNTSLQYQYLIKARKQ